MKLENARLNVSLTWDDYSAPGYVVSYTVDSPTPIPNGLIPIQGVGAV